MKGGGGGENGGPNIFKGVGGGPESSVSGTDKSKHGL